MTRLKLIVADADESYAESVVEYIMLNYSHRFQVSSFTNKVFLGEYLSDKSNKIDILLVGSDLYSDLITQERIDTVILLTTGNVNDENQNYPAINKYQQGDKLISEIINIYSKKEDREVVNVAGDKNTKIIAVYSPVGGSGKTTIAVNSAIQCAQRGKSVFYLNLEDFQSTPLYFEYIGEQNLSNILYYLKDKSKNLHLKIEGARCVDSEYNVHYFSPLESLLDLDEIQPDELKILLNEFKSMSQYDMVFVDMSSSFDEKNITILDSCDEILFVIPQDAVSDIKANIFSKELEILKQRKGLDFLDKMTVVLNKYNSYMALEVDTVCIQGHSVKHYIPFVPGMMYIKGNNRLMDLQGEFTDSMQELIEDFI